MQRHVTPPSSIDGNLRRRTPFATLLVVLGLCALPALAAAQAGAPTAPPTDPAKPDAAAADAAEKQKEADAKAVEEATEAGAGEEIIVTARKREENVQEVPIAVTVKTGEQLDDSGAQTIAQLQGEVPNLTVYAGRNQSSTLTAFIRGIGQADPLWGVDPGVGLYLDDVYVARPQGALLDVFDLQRVEVLRGPQGTLYGKNTIGGAIKFVSNPLGDKTEAKISVTPGSYNNQDVKASISGALIDGKLRAKAAFASLKHDGYGTNLFTGRDVADRDTQALRLALDWLPAETVKLQFAYDKTKDSAEPRGYQRLQPNQFCPLLLGRTCAPLDSRYDTESGLAPINGTDSSGYSAVLTWDINKAWRFKSITGYRETDAENNIDFDTTPARIVDVSATYSDHQTTEELQFLYGNGGKIDGVFGAYYFNGEAGGLVKNIFLNGIAGFGTTNGTTKTKSIALFGDFNYHATSQLTFILGLRGTQEKKNGVAFNAGYSDDTFTHVTSVLADYDKSKTFSSVAPKLGVDYQFTADVMGYLSLSRGFKSGGFNVRAQSNLFPQSAEPFKDEVQDVAEVGLKSLLADRTLVLNTAVFYGKYRDIQVSTFTAYDSNHDGVEDAFFGNFLNAGDAIVKGAEVEYDWNGRSIQWLGFSGNVSYLSAKPTEFLDENHDHFVDTQVITNAPEWTGALRANVHFPLFGGLLTGSVGGAYRGEAILTNEGGSFAGRAVQPISQDSYTLYDAWIGWLSPAAQWRFALTGRNLTDEKYRTNGYNIPALGVRTGAYGDPRVVTFTVEYRFF